MSTMTILYASLALIFVFQIASSSSSSISGYSAEIDDQTVITIRDAYPKKMSPKAWAAVPKEVRRINVENGRNEWIKNCLSFMS